MRSFLGFVMLFIGTPTRALHVETGEANDAQQQQLQRVQRHLRKLVAGESSFFGAKPDKQYDECGEEARQKLMTPLLPKGEMEEEEQQQQQQQQIHQLEGQYSLVGSGRTSVKGAYSAVKTDDSVSITDVDSKIAVGTFTYDPIGKIPVLTNGKRDLPRIKLVNSEVIKEIQKKENKGAYFVLPSQLNGAKYLSHRDVVTHIAAYERDNTGGARGQLAVHPAAGQFILDNAASDKNPNGLNAVKEAVERLRKAGFKFFLKNGFLGIPRITDSAQQEEAEKVFLAAGDLFRMFVMSNVPASGLTPNLDGWSDKKHTVNLVYASAVPVESYLNDCEDQKEFQVRIARINLILQYYGALRHAARGAKGGPAVVYLMPLGGGVFNNPFATIAEAMSIAVELLDSTELDKLDIRVLTFDGTNGEEVEEAGVMDYLLKDFKKLRS